MDRPKKYKPPEIDKSSECVAAWEALIGEEGYPMTCTGVVAQGYFSAGWRYAAERMNAMQKAEEKTPPTKVPE